MSNTLDGTFLFNPGGKNQGGGGGRKKDLQGDTTDKTTDSGFMWNPTETNCSEIPNDRTAHIRSIFQGSKFDNRELSCHAIICFTHSRFFFRDLELTADQTLKIFKIVSEFEKFRVFKKTLQFLKGDEFL